MKTSEWLAIAGLVVSISLAGVAGWTQLSERLSNMEEHLRNKEKVNDIVRQTAIQNMKEIHELKGMHTEHKHTSGAAGDESVMAEAYLSESEM